ncbi:MAG: fluoride efflux transporter CrcB [Saprospiraceae bacterium]|nr:fluoride efflux transporter CrcB [Saprospiraceae bacterium]
MKLILIIGAGSFIGGVARYLLGQWVQAKAATAFPYGTLAVNVLGCLAIGLVLGWSVRHSPPVEWRFFLATGFCGGFTTFSTFSNETLALLREGQTAAASAYVVASLALGLLATWVGISVFRLF